MPATPSTQTATHGCPAESCGSEIPAEMFMCPVHWKMISAALRDSLKATIPSGHPVDPDPSPEYLAFAKAAIADVAHKEARKRPPKTRASKKPVQLKLF